MKPIKTAAISANNVNAIGQENLPDWAELDIGRCRFDRLKVPSMSRETLGVERLLLNPKKYRPPRPMGVKGGCSPQNNRRKLRR